MPAEWEQHEATWIGWPHQKADWPKKFGPIPWVYGEIIRKISLSEIVRILVNSELEHRRARLVLRRIGVDPSRVEFFKIATDRGWTRDIGPIFARQQGGSANSLAVVKFHFNGWAKYPDCQKDAVVPEAVAPMLGLPLIDAQVEGHPFILEGGSIDLNGAGAVMTTEECLLDPVVQTRNPQLNRNQIESGLKRYLGVNQVLWLGRGIVGDDTHGHVDDLCRFVNINTVLLASEDNPLDENYAALQENYERLQGMRLADGSAITVVRLPMPAPLYCDGMRLPASYANFYIANHVVVVPTFNDPNDRKALGILAEHFPNREVVGVHAVDLVWGLGTIHCLTQQQPVA